MTTKEKRPDLRALLRTVLLKAAKHFETWFVIPLQPPAANDEYQFCAFEAWPASPVSISRDLVDSVIHPATVGTICQETPNLSFSQPH